MSKAFAPLPAVGLPAGIAFHLPRGPEAPPVTLDDPAVAVMTDFTRVRAITVAPQIDMAYAYRRMIVNGVRLLLVVSEENHLLGLVTSTDVEGDRPLQVMHQRGLGREELLVADVMTPHDRLEAIGMAAVDRARVGNVVATLKVSGRRHALVMDRSPDGLARVRGLFSATQIERQLGGSVGITEIAASFAQVEAMLQH